jgi:hypothetical protein
LKDDIAAPLPVFFERLIEEAPEQWGGEFQARTKRGSMITAPPSCS